MAEPSTRSGDLPQAPEYTPEWDKWIAEFRHTFHKVLLTRLYQYSKHEVAGNASVIFSVDNRGTLRGSICEGTADDTLCYCLLQTVTDLDHTPMLKFPTDTSVTGWNFRMRFRFPKNARCCGEVASQGS